jgi:hypothetical protein
MKAFGEIDPGMLGLILVLIWVGLTSLYLGFNSKKKPGFMPGVSVFSWLIRVIGQAVEDGSRVTLSLGRAGLNGQAGMAGIAGLSILRKILPRTASGDEVVLTTSGDAGLEILASGLYDCHEENYEQKDAFETDSSQLVGLTPFSYAAGVMPVLNQTKTKVNILAGHFGSEAGLLLDSADQPGVVAFGGTDNLPGQAIMYAMADHPIIGEELFSAASLLNEDPAASVSLKIQDIARWGIVIVILVGIILRMMGTL